MIFLTCRIFLIFVLCVCLLVTGVFASEPNTIAGYTSFNLLDGVVVFNGGQSFVPEFLYDSSTTGVRRLTFEYNSYGGYVNTVYLCISGYKSTNITAVTLSRGSKVVDGTVLAGVYNNNGWFVFDWGGWISGELTITVEYRTNALAQSTGCYLAAAMAYSINMVQVPWMQVSYGHTSMSSFRSASVGQTVWTQFGAPSPDNPLNSSMTVKLRYGIDGYYGDKLIATFYVPFLSDWDTYDNWALPYLVKDVSALVVDNGVERVHLPVDFKATYMPTRPISVGQGTWSSCFYVECVVDLSDNTLAGYISPSVELRIVSPGFVLDYDASGQPESYGCALEIGVAGYSRPIGSVTPDAGLVSWLNDKLDYIGTLIGDVVDPEVPDEVQNAQDNADAAIDSASQWEQDQYNDINSGSANTGQTVSSGIASFGNALAFVQTYTANIANGIDDYLIVFTLPIFVGIFLYVCSRVPGITRAFRDRRPDD
jgi:hypothetical protein